MRSINYFHNNMNSKTNKFSRVFNLLKAVPWTSKPNCTQVFFGALFEFQNTCAIFLSAKNIWLIFISIFFFYFKFDFQSNEKKIECILLRCTAASANFSEIVFELFKDDCCVCWTCTVFKTNIEVFALDFVWFVEIAERKLDGIRNIFIILSAQVRFVPFQLILKVAAAVITFLNQLNVFKSTTSCNWALLNPYDC